MRCAKFRFFLYDHNSIEIQTAMEIDLHAIKSVMQKRVYPPKSLEQSPKLKVRRRGRRRGAEWGKSIPLPSRLGLWGSAVSPPSGVRGRAPAKNEFGAF